MNGIFMIKNRDHRLRLQEPALTSSTNLFDARGLMSRCCQRVLLRAETMPLTKLPACCVSSLGPPVL